jgi:signal peptide peptidase SppA
MMLYHRIAARLYNKPLLLIPSAAFAVSEFLLSRVEQPRSQQPLRSSSDKRANRFVGSHYDDENNYHPYRVTDGTAVVQVVGELVNRSGGWVDADCGVISYEYIQYQIDCALNDPKVLSIVLDIDSPGGEVNGCFALAEYLRKVRSVKPIVSFGNANALSGGYSIESSALKIVAPKDSEHGSIGVWMLHYDFSKHLEQHGVKPTLVFDGAHKVDGHPFAPLPESVESEWKIECQRIRTMFAASVAAGRKSLSVDAILATEARCYYAEDAVKLGLIDQIGSFDDALGLAKSLRGKGTVVNNPTRGVAGKKIKKPTRSANATEGNVDNCANANCGHPHDDHPDDGACTVDGCECEGFVAEDTNAEGESEAETNAKKIQRLEETNRQLQAKNQTEARKRITAEVEKFAAPLLANKDDLRFNVQSVGIYSNLLIVAESAAAGLSSATIKGADGDREVKINVKSLGAFVATQIKSLTKSTAKFDPPGGELKAPDNGATSGGVTLKDFEIAATNNAASKKIMDEVQRRRVKDPKFTKAALLKELQQPA